MLFSKKKEFSFLEKIRKKRLSFFCLNIAQFLGALNDNIYKLLTIFFLISSLGVNEASGIISAVGALYVIPFLLFSSAAGILADRFSKQKLIVGLKGFEIALMILSLLAFFYKSIWGTYSLLFLLASHSAFFGPSKYGILAELVEKQNTAKANGIITAFTYLAIIIGTFLASFLTDFTHQNYVLAVSFCLLFSIIGFLATLGIRKTEPQKSAHKIHFFFLREIVKTILEARKTPLLAPSLLGSSFFLFIGAFTQLNIIPFAIESLQLSEYAGGYLFLLTALGIAVGSFIAGKIFKKKLNLGVSCLMGLVISLLFFLIWIFSSFLIPTSIFLALLGVAGGVFVISFDTFIQLKSETQKRGQTIAAANFLSFLGVLIASFCLYLFGYLMGFSPALSFLCMGIITLIVTLFLGLRLFAVALPFFSHLFPPKIEDSDQGTLKGSLFISEKFDMELLWKASFLSSSCLILLKKKDLKKRFFFLRICPNVVFLEEDCSLSESIKKAQRLLEDGVKVYLFFQDSIYLDELEKKETIFSFSDQRIYFCSLKKDRTLLIEKVFL